MQSIIKRLIGDDPARKRRSLRDSLKWAAFIVSFVCFTTGRFIVFMRLIHDEGDASAGDSTAELFSASSGTILPVTLVLSIILGALTVPRWQGFLALEIVVWAIWNGLAF